MTTTIALPLSEVQRVLALSIMIVSPETLEKAQVNLGQIRSATKSMVAAIKALKGPHQEEIKKIDAAAKPWKDKLDARDTALERAILDYNRLVRLAAEERQRKELEKYEKKVERVETKAIEQGKPIPIVLPPPIFASPPKTVEVDGSKQTTIKRKAWRLQVGTDPDYCDYQVNLDRQLGIPPQYFKLDTAMVGKVVRAGGVIPGIEIYEEESLSVRT
ncbi:MAG: hypothetical protein ACREJQ_04615 [bacterium]